MVLQRMIEQPLSFGVYSPRKASADIPALLGLPFENLFIL